MKKKIIIAIFLIVATLTFSLFFTSCTNSGKAKFVTTEVESTVTNIQHFEMHRNTSDSNKQLTKIEHYLVTLNYCSIYQTFDSQALFETVKKNDIVHTKLCQEFDDDGKIVNQYLALK